MVKLARKQLIKKKKLHTAETVKQHKIQKVAELAQLPRMDKIHQKQSNVLSEIRLKMVSLAPNRKQTFCSATTLKTDLFSGKQVQKCYVREKA